MLFSFMPISVHEAFINFFVEAPPMQFIQFRPAHSTYMKNNRLVGVILKTNKFIVVMIIHKLEFTLPDA